MENGQNTQTGKGSEPKVDTLGGSTKSKNSASMPLGASESSSPLPMTATTRKDLVKTWKSAALEELRSKAGLVAGALADFQTAGGLVVVKNIEFEPGKFAPKIYLVAEGLNIRIEKTADGLDFDIQPLPSGTSGREDEKV